jgi:hypothetical protein
MFPSVQRSLLTPLPLFADQPLLDMLPIAGVAGALRVIALDLVDDGDKIPKASDRRFVAVIDARRQLEQRPEQNRPFDEFHGSAQVKHLPNRALVGFGQRALHHASGLDDAPNLRDGRFLVLLLLLRGRFFPAVGSIIFRDRS